MFYTARELADHLYYSEEHVRRLAREGKIPGSKIGKFWRFDREHIEAWLKDGFTSDAIGMTLIIGLTDEPTTIYHRLEREPSNVILTVTTSGTPGLPPLLGQVTASSLVLIPQSASGQVVRVTPL